MIRLLILLLAVLLTACSSPMAPRDCGDWMYAPLVDAHGQTITTARVKVCP